MELITNLAENSMRPIVLGRKNWIHISSPQAGPKVTAIMSVIETCRRIKISARDHLSAVLPGLADTPPAVSLSPVWRRCCSRFLAELARLSLTEKHRPLQMILLLYQFSALITEI